MQCFAGCLLCLLHLFPETNLATNWFSWSNLLDLCVCLQNTIIKDHYSWRIIDDLHSFVNRNIQIKELIIGRYLGSWSRKLLIYLPRLTLFKYMLNKTCCLWHIEEGKNNNPEWAIYISSWSIYDNKQRDVCER